MYIIIWFEFVEEAQGIPLDLRGQGLCPLAAAQQPQDLPTAAEGFRASLGLHPEGHHAQNAGLYVMSNSHSRISNIAFQCNFDIVHLNCTQVKINSQNKKFKEILDVNMFISWNNYVEYLNKKKNKNKKLKWNKYTTCLLPNKLINMYF